MPLTLATGVWTVRVVGPDGLLNRAAYTFLVLERLREALRRRDVYALVSQRWADPRARLLDGRAWDAARSEVATSLGHDLDQHRELAVLTEDLDAAYRAVADRFEHNDAVRIETIDGHDRPVLTALDKLDEPPSLLALRTAVDDLLPRVDLPEACNTGLEPVVQASNAIVLWNTRYQDAALNQLQGSGFDVRDDDVQRLSPLGHEHINLLGRYQFSATDLIDGQLRPLRDPTAPDA